MHSVGQISSESEGTNLHSKKRISPQISFTLHTPDPSSTAILQQQQNQQQQQANRNSLGLQLESSSSYPPFKTSPHGPLAGRSESKSQTVIDSEVNISGTGPPPRVQPPSGRASYRTPSATVHNSNASTATLAEHQIGDLANKSKQLGAAAVLAQNAAQNAAPEAGFAWTVPHISSSSSQRLSAVQTVKPPVEFANKNEHQNPQNVGKTPEQLPHEQHSAHSSLRPLQSDDHTLKATPCTAATTTTTTTVTTTEGSDSYTNSGAEEAGPAGTREVDTPARTAPRMVLSELESRNLQIIIPSELQVRI